MDHRMSFREPKSMVRCETVELTTEDYVKRIRVESALSVRERTVGFLRKAYGFSIFCTFVLFFLQGFGALGFNLNMNFLQWLGAATVAQIAGLFAMVLKVK
jgi:hypothetical protein